MAGGLTRLGAPRGRRRAALFVLMLAVITVHGCVGRQIAAGLTDFGAAQAMPPRIEVAYVRDMALAAPPAVAPTVPTVVAAPTRAPVAVDAAASAPKAAKKRPVPKPVAAPPTAPEPEPAPLDDAEVVAQAPAEIAADPSPEASSAAEPASAPALAATSTDEAASSTLAAASPSDVEPPAPAASGAAPFEWPVSTRVSYLLTGNYRGEVQGDAHVEWVKAGSRYQVHLDLTVGPSFAPVVSRRMSSDGEITAAGLQPRRYDQVTSVAFRSPRRVSVAFEPDAVLLANGHRAAQVAGLQDTASQFVQLTYLFSTRPDRLRAGNSVEVPLALPHKVDLWTYDVLGEETLHTPFGELPTFHLKPRRAVPKAGELSAEIWFAPGLRYLPVRIRVQQDAATFIDLTIARPPQMAGP